MGSMWARKHVGDGHHGPTRWGPVSCQVSKKAVEAYSSAKPRGSLLSGFVVSYENERYVPAESTISPSG